MVSQIVVIPAFAGMTNIGVIMTFFGTIKTDEPLKSNLNVSLLTKRKICFMLNTDIIKISLFVRDDKLLVQIFYEALNYKNAEIQLDEKPAILSGLLSIKPKSILAAVPQLFADYKINCRTEKFA